MNSLMQLDRKSLRSLIERAQAIHNKLNDEIESSISFCKFCFERGRYCDVAETSFPERERLIAIRNSLNEVENMLVYLQLSTRQKLQSWQLIDRHAAFSCLESSRIYLKEQVTRYQGRQVDVVKELTACFGHEEPAFHSNLKNKKIVSPEVPNGKRRIFSFFIRCIRFHSDPWKWQKAVGITAKLIIVSASISSTIHFYHSRKKYCSSHTKILSVDSSSTDARANNSSKRPLDVSSVRG